MNDLAGTDLWTLAVIVALGGVSVLSSVFVESGGGTFAGSLFGPAVTRIELQDR